MAATFKVSDEVRAVLASAEIDATSVRLTGQLERKLYLAVNKVLEGAGGRWDRRAQKHVFASDPRELLGLAVETGKATNRQQLLQAFYTPPELADRVAELADAKPQDRVLEPSAGNGALLDAVVRWSPLPNLSRSGVTAYDIDPLAVEVLRGAGYDATCADFLRVPIPVYPAERFDRVIMNPPWTKGQDVAHVTHALHFLKQGGRLVAIMSPAWRTSRTRATTIFREGMDGLGAEVEDVHAGAFKDSGTDVRSVILTVEMP